MANLISGTARALLKPINTSVMVFLGAYTMLWGFWVANPFWTVFTQAQLYNALNMMGGEVVWGTAAFICGAITVYGVIKPSYHALVRSALAAAGIWFFIAIFYFIGDWQNTGGITASLLCFYGAFIWLNLRVNRRRYGWNNDESNNHLIKQRDWHY